jgi:hypothetical protein
MVTEPFDTINDIRMSGDITAVLHAYLTRMLVHACLTLAFAPRDISLRMMSDRPDGAPQLLFM